MKFVRNTLYIRYLKPMEALSVGSPWRARVEGRGSDVVWGSSGYKLFGTT